MISDRVQPQVGSRVAVLLEPGRHGSAALERAAAVAAGPDCELTVVAVAPTAATVCRSCGGVSPHAYNCAVYDDVATQLGQAMARLRGVTQWLDARLLVEGADPPLAQWIAERHFDVVVLPSRWALAGTRRHPAARRLRRDTPADVLVV